MSTISEQAMFIMDCHGHFCIEVDGIRGEVVQYEAIAPVKVGSFTYLGVSAYFDGVLPVEQVLQYTPVTSESVSYDRCNLYQPLEPCQHEEVRNNNRVRVK